MKKVNGKYDRTLQEVADKELIGASQTEHRLHRSDCTRQDSSRNLGSDNEAQTNQAQRPMEFETMARTNSASIIALDKFIQATRDSGYKGTTSAVAELVDNSLQAGAKHVWIEIIKQDDNSAYPIHLSVLDDGCGMDKKTLRQALRFGGSSRFDDRNGMGRYGMGLPNSSLSQARRVEVYTWQRTNRANFSYLDVDEIADGKMTEIPSPVVRSIPHPLPIKMPNTGTQVLWTQCDRLSHARISTITRKLSQFLGRVFRYHVWNGAQILINGEPIKAIDPLYLQTKNKESDATVYGEPMIYEVNIPSNNGSPSVIGSVTVTFTELPVHQWHKLSNDEKRQRGISNGAGVSVVRANREIDYGWFFMGNKRRENYDDWWRCEIRFDPLLDEVFGITHSKQQIRPQEFISNILNPDIESTAKALNSRVRQAHLRLKTNQHAQEAEQRASDREPLLSPLPKQRNTPERDSHFKQLVKQHPDLKKASAPGKNGQIKYRIVEGKSKESFFYSCVRDGDLLVVAVNPDHPFCKKIYRPLTERSTPEYRELRNQIDLMLFAAARAEISMAGKLDQDALSKFRAAWSDTLATFLNR